MLYTPPPSNNLREINPAGSSRSHRFTTFAMTIVLIRRVYAWRFFGFLSTGEDRKHGRVYVDAVGRRRAKEQDCDQALDPSLPEGRGEAKTKGAVCLSVHLSVHLSVCLSIPCLCMTSLFGLEDDFVHVSLGVSCGVCKREKNTRSRALCYEL